MTGKIRQSRCHGPGILLALVVGMVCIPDSWSYINCISPISLNLNIPDGYKNVTVPQSSSSSVCQWNLYRVVDTYSKNYYIHVHIPALYNLSCYLDTRLTITDLTTREETRVCGFLEPLEQVYHNNVQIEYKLGEYSALPSDLLFSAVLTKLSYFDTCNESHSLPQLSSMRISGKLNPGKFLIPFDCWWDFYTQNHDDRVTMVLENVSMGSQYGCGNGNNYISAYDVYDYSKVYFRVCDATNKQYTSTGRTLRVHISINQPISQPARFEMTVKKQDSCLGEDGVLAATTNTHYIYSPNYPGQYSANTDCSWEIRSNEYEIELEIIELDLESSPDCNMDYVEIYDYYGSYIQSKLLGRFCGSRSNSNSKTFRSSNRRLLVKFHSDDSREYSGFRMQYQTREKPSENVENSSNSDNEGSNDNTALLVGASLAAVIGAVGLILIILWLMHRRSRVNHRRERRRRRRRADAAAPQMTSDTSSVFMINSVVFGQGAPPPPYHGLVNAGFMDDLPPGYQEAISQLPSQVALGGAPPVPPPPAYSASVPAGHESRGGLATDDEAQPEAVYNNATESVRLAQEPSSLNEPIYEMISTPREETSAATIAPSFSTTIVLPSNRQRMVADTDGSPPALPPANPVLPPADYE